MALRSALDHRYWQWLRKLGLAVLFLTTDNTR